MPRRKRKDFSPRERLHQDLWLARGAFANLRRICSDNYNGMYDYIKEVEQGFYKNRELALANTNHYDK